MIEPRHVVEIIVALVLAVFGSTGFFALVQSRLSRKDEKEDRSDSVKEKQDSLDRKIEALEKQQKSDIVKMQQVHDTDIDGINKSLKLLVGAVQALLKDCIFKGDACNEVVEAANDIEKSLREKAYR